MAKGDETPYFGVMKPTAFFTLFAAGLASFVLAATTHTLAQSRTDALSSLQGEKRVLLLFAKSRSDASLTKQVDLLRNYRPELRERDLIVLSTPDRTETSSVIGYASLPRGTGRALRDQYAPAPIGLTVVLIGKDGGEKQRWQNVVEPETIFEIIDAMPMRQQEIQRNGADSAAPSN